MTPRMRMSWVGSNPGRQYGLSEGIEARKPMVRSMGSYRGHHNINS